MNAQGGISTSQDAGQGMALSDEQLERLKEYYGFDKPVLQSYAEWLWKVVRGDLGMSYRYNEPVWDVISERFPISLYYGITTLIITYAVCIWGPESHSAQDGRRQHHVHIHIRRLRHSRLRPRVTAVAVFLGAPGVVSHGWLCVDAVS